MSRKVVLHRKWEQQGGFEEELQAMKDAGFITLDSRIDIEPGDIVVGRYSVLPFYREQEFDIAKAGGTLINSYEQHRYIADLKNWYQDLEDLTPTTWFDPAYIPFKEYGPFVVKGETNSKKFLWDTHMFAKTRKDIGQVMSNLHDDGLIGYQKIYVRKYEKLNRYATGFHGLPITEEYRFFVAFGKILSGAFYWSSHVEDIDSPTNCDAVPKEFLAEVVKRVGDSANFYAVDIAIKADGSPIVIELNDGQMSGLSENDPELLFRNLYAAIDCPGGKYEQ